MQTYKPRDPLQIDPCSEKVLARMLSFMHGCLVLSADGSIRCSQPPTQCLILKWPSAWYKFLCYMVGVSSSSTACQVQMDRCSKIQCQAYVANLTSVGLLLCAASFPTLSSSSNTLRPHIFWYILSPGSAWSIVIILYNMVTVLHGCTFDLSQGILSHVSCCFLGNV